MTERRAISERPRPPVVTLDDIGGVLAQCCPTTRVFEIHNGPSGYSSQMWLASTDEGQLLVRLPSRNVESEQARGMIVATRLASENEVPVVRFRAFMSDSSLGRPVLVQEFRRAERASAVVQERSSAVDEIATVLGNWVAQIHAINRDHFGSVLLRTEGAWGEIVLGKVREALDFLPASVIPRSRSTIESAFSRVVACLPTDIVPSLVHGDLYLDNVLVEGTRPVTLLDFEHSYFADRFADFGKLEELLFGWFPASKLPFLEAYHHHFPPQDGDDSRYLLAIGLYELSQLAYFMRWQPELAPEYRDRLQSWLNRT